MSITLPPAPADDSHGRDERRSAWFVASRRRLGFTEEFWYDPAVEHLLDALGPEGRLVEAAEELGSARGAAGFDLRETASDLDALAEILPDEVARRLHDEATLAALSAWADAFVDRAHPPACVDAMTGLVTTGYLRVRVEEVHRSCDEHGRSAADTHAFVVVRPPSPPRSPLARLAGRMRAGRGVREWFPGGESACLLDESGALVLARRDDRLAPRARGLAAALGDHSDSTDLIRPLGPDLAATHRQLDVLTGIPGRRRR